MLSYQNCTLYFSFSLYLGIKILCDCIVRSRDMYKQATLTSIPERNEGEDDHDMTRKWVPKKKHEVLKAKYKCLKKLFQIYDASVIGILPETFNPDGYLEEDLQKKKKRKRRSHRTKTDACAGTTEISSGDVNQMMGVSEKELVASAVFKDLQTVHCSCSSTHVESNCSKDVENKCAASVGVKEKVLVKRECECTQTSETQPVHPIPYFMVSEKRKLTRFQIFIQRILGIRPEPSPKKNFALPNGHIYAASDNMITSTVYAKRRRRGLRFRRIRRPKKIQSEMTLRNVKSPIILTYVQSVQKSCLMDTTQRHCPILGCDMISYGIINYNDHLNLCHFTDRKFFCHYCHKGFEKEYDKFIHENQHLGISKLSNFQQQNLCDNPQPFQKATITQTDPETTDIKYNFSDDKLKKIMSFFDKISDPEHVTTEVKKDRFSESNLQQSKTDLETGGESVDCDKRSTVSCVNLSMKVNNKSSGVSEGFSKLSCGTPVICRYCGENFNFRRQLSLHVDLEHKFRNKFSKFNSCAGIIQHPIKMKSVTKMDMVSEDGKIQVQSVDRTHGCHVVTSATVSQSSVATAPLKSEDSLSCDPSTNIVYYTSLDPVKKPSVVENIVQKVKKLNSYKWEPGTKIIRV